MQATPVQPEAPPRFSVLHRFLHLVVMIGFTGLALTGLSLGFSSTAPARAFMWLVGGPAHAGWLHRFCAVITYGCVAFHALWFLYFKFGLASAQAWILFVVIMVLTYLALRTSGRWVYYAGGR